MNEVEAQKLRWERFNNESDLQHARQDFQDDLNLRRTEELSTLQRAVAQAITDIGREQQFDLIAGERTFFASHRIDIANPVVAQLKKEYRRGNKGTAKAFGGGRPLIRRLAVTVRGRHRETRTFDALFSRCARPYVAAWRPRSQSL